MLFLRNNLKKICINWINENSEYYRGRITSLINEGLNSDEEYLQIYKDVNNLFFKKATDFINNSNDATAILRWNILPSNPDVCDFEIDYANINIGMIYIMLYYCFSGNPSTKKDIQIYTQLNHFNHSVLNNILIQFNELYGENNGN
jgi:hypothetical protein